MTKLMQQFNTKNFEDYYAELTSRQQHFISFDLQNKIKETKILIAGCGTTGGACIDPLVRLGVCHFLLADQDTYELSNLNRQQAKLEDIGFNKAEFYKSEVLKINPYANITLSTKGLHIGNIEEFVRGSDFVFDAIDVTTRGGIEAKVLLHQKCHELRKPVLSGIDLGFLQYGQSFDYRDEGLSCLNGKTTKILKSTHPIASLFNLFPLSVVPKHCYPLIWDLLENKEPKPASQLGCTAHALSALIVPALLNFLDTGVLIKEWSIDLYPYRLNTYRRAKIWLECYPMHRRIKKRIKKLSV